MTGLALLTVFLASAASTANAWVQQGDEDLTVALTGDAILTRPLSVHREPAFVDAIERIRSADVAFTNIEMLFHDYEASPAHASGGIHFRADPQMAAELAWAGFDLASLANNHAGDYGPMGMRLTRRHAEAAGLRVAGTGESLAEAREATFLDTPKGRIALIALASTFPDHARAADARGAVRGRPGLNPLRFDTTYVLRGDGMESLRHVAAQLGVPLRADSAGGVRFLGRRFMPGQEPGVRTEPDPRDQRAIAAIVSNASRLADLTIVTIHAHEGDGSRERPAQFLVAFARSMIDAGADLFVGHGPHVLRGIEIYRGKPIFYSLGDFIFENETIARLAAEDYEAFDLGPDRHVADFNDVRYDRDRRGFPATPEVWESVIAVPRWRNKTLRGIDLYPISLGFGQPRTRRGRPMLADETLGRKIIDDLIDRSEPFGTVIEHEANKGVVRILPPHR